MRILYLSDRYAWDVYGVKRSLFEEMQTRGHEMIWHDRAETAPPHGTFDQIWAAHSGLKPLHTSARTIIGFGFSDPTNFARDRFAHYTAYVTNHFETWKIHRHLLPMHYMPSSCDLRFHRSSDLEREILISLVGTAVHPCLRPQRKRVEWVKKLTRLGLDVRCWGSGWPSGPCIGSEFLAVLGRSRVGLDISEIDSAPAHRLFEYPACGTPVITRRRPEVALHFRENEEVLLYDELEDLAERLKKWLWDPAYVARLAEVGAAAKSRCLAEHTIGHRVDALLGFIEESCI
jgi:hypothetical protein